MSYNGWIKCPGCGACFGGYSDLDKCRNCGYLFKIKVEEPKERVLWSLTIWKLTIRITWGR